MKTCSTNARLVREYCPTCKTDIALLWDTDVSGYEIFCPCCGNRLILCDECYRRNGCAGETDNSDEACARRFSRSPDDSSTHPETRNIWLRVGGYLPITAEEEKIIFGDSEEDAEKILQEAVQNGRFCPSGDSYIPETVIDEYNQTYGTDYPVRDVGFDC